jgi:peroxiredoxin
MRSDIISGAIFPGYELSDHSAKRRKLSELQGQHPKGLVLSPGGSCPKDRRQAELLVQLHRELEVAYCRLVTISTDNISETNEYRGGVGAHWPLLSDSGAYRVKGSRHSRVHRSCSQPGDSARDCASARPCCL